MIMAGDLADAALLDKAELDHLPLHLGQPFHQLRQHGAAFDIVTILPVGDVPWQIRRLPRLGLPPIHQRVRRYPQQPGHEGDTAPLVPWKIRQRLLEDLRRDVFSGYPIAGTSAHVGVDPVKVTLVELDEPGRIRLRRLNQRSIVRVL